MTGIIVRAVAPVLMLPYGSFVLRPLIDQGASGYTIAALFAAPLVGFLAGCVGGRDHA